MKILIKSLFLVLIGISLLLSKDNEISWEEASIEVDSFPFSLSFIDSVKKKYEVTFPDSPLRSLLQSHFFVPETLVYEVSWGSFPAGYVIINSHLDTITNTIKIGGKALSNNFISIFYRMRDYVISTIDPVGIYPLFFEQHLRENKYIANEYLLFDHIKGKVYSQSKKDFKIEKAPKFVQDYLSVLYLIRSTGQLVPGKNFSEYLFIHSKAHSIPFSVIETNDNIHVKAGKFSSPILLIPKLAGEGRVFNKKDMLEIWFTNDQRKLPVMVKAKIKFGYLYGRLLWYNRLD